MGPWAWVKREGQLAWLCWLWSWCEQVQQARDTSSSIWHSDGAACYLMGGDVSAHLMGVLTVLIRNRPVTDVLWLSSCRRVVLAATPQGGSAVATPCARAQHLLVCALPMTCLSQHEHRGCCGCSSSDRSHHQGRTRLLRKWYCATICSLGGA